MAKSHWKLLVRSLFQMFVRVLATPLTYWFGQLKTASVLMVFILASEFLRTAYFFDMKYCLLKTFLKKLLTCFHRHEEVKLFCGLLPAIKRKKKQTNNISIICNTNQELEETYHPVSQVNTTLTKAIVV